MFFSIIVVCLNPGDRLEKTLESIEGQSFRDFEVIVKDGMSRDGSLDYARALAQRWKQESGKPGSTKKIDQSMPDDVPSIRILEKRDQGIYDAMNQAAAEAAGKYVYFLNCGDRFYSEDVLEKMADFIKEKENADAPGIFYGNIFEHLTGQQVISNPHIDAFGCYRNVPCHQACFYDRRLLLAHPFETKYLVRADYEQFLWCFFQSNAAFHYIELMVVNYEGGGFSETKENRRISAREHKEITEKYIPGRQLLKFKLILWLTLAPLRTKIAENEKMAGVYNRIKKMLYLHR